MDEWIKTLYKSNRGFARNLVENRRETMNERRRNQRMSQIDHRRHIDVMASPVPLQNSAAENQVKEETKPKEKPKNNRLEQLKKWKEEKEKRKLEEKKKRKPVFRWCAVQHTDIYGSSSIDTKQKSYSTLDFTSRNAQKTTTKKTPMVSSSSKPATRESKRANTIQSAPGTSQLSRSKPLVTPGNATSTNIPKASISIPKSKTNKENSSNCKSNTNASISKSSIRLKTPKKALEPSTSKTITSNSRVTRTRVPIVQIPENNTDQINLPKIPPPKMKHSPNVVSKSTASTPSNRQIDTNLPKSSSRSLRRRSRVLTSTPNNETTTDGTVQLFENGNQGLEQFESKEIDPETSSQEIKDNASESTANLNVPSNSKKDLDIIFIIEKPRRRNSSFANASGIVEVTNTNKNVENVVSSPQPPRKSEIAQIGSARKTKTPRKTLENLKISTPCNSTAKNTRSSRLIQSAVDSQSENNGQKTPRKNSTTPAASTDSFSIAHSSKKRRSVKNSALKSIESDVYLTPNDTSSNRNFDDVFVTPNSKNPDDLVVYVSPFVTTSRGKSQARREYQMRKSMEARNTSIGFLDDAQSPKAAASYFTRILDSEIAKIQEKCREWEELKNSGNLSEDACGLIDLSIGQSNLLISKKFNQFRGLIEKCRVQDDSEIPVRCEDLHGFWDMIYKQVIDVNKRFENLEEMKRNNWLEEAPLQKQPKKDNIRKRKRKPTSTSGSSLLKDAIAAARKKMVKRNSSEVEVCIVGEKPSTSSDPINMQTEISTPGRGILKSQNTRSEKRKTVVFKDARTSLSANKENEKTRSAKKSTPHHPIRRSLRLTMSATKLEFE